MSSESLYLNKPDYYIDHIVWEIVFEIPEGSNKILDIGCGGALTGLTLKQHKKASEVIGIDISKAAAERAALRIDKVIVGNIEEMDLNLPDGYFDYVILGDILEHLINPWEFLKKINKYLKQNGRMLVTIPNVRCWRVVVPLIFKGAWSYEWQGILDKSHLRFFTKKTIYQLFNDAGLNICKIKAMVGSNLVSGYSSKTITAFLDKFTLGLFREFLAPGYFIVSSKS
ncbi:MAG: class I SAM-dependent methyltransferase [Candidatus Omnitrophota bacterium]